MKKLRTFHRDADYIKICEVKYLQINFIFFEFLKKYKKPCHLGLIGLIAGSSFDLLKPDQRPESWVDSSGWVRFYIFDLKSSNNQ
jgi:hypothetical protein